MNYFLKIIKNLKYKKIFYNIKNYKILFFIKFLNPFLFIYLINKKLTYNFKTFFEYIYILFKKKLLIK